MAYSFDPNLLNQPSSYEFVPFQEPRGTMSNLGIGFGGAVVNTVGGLYDALRFATNKQLPEFDMNKMYNEWVGQTGYNKEFDYGEFFDRGSDYWQTGQGARDIGGLVGSIASLWVPGGIVAKGAGAVGKAAGLSSAMIRTVQGIAGGAAAGLGESAVEYGSNRAEAESLLSQGKSTLTQSEIEQRSAENFIANLGFTMGGNIALGALAFAAPGGKVFGKILKDGNRFANVAKKAVIGGAEEYLQENLQTQSGAYTRGEWQRPLSPHDISPEGLAQTASVLLPQNQTPEEKLSSLLGAVGGGIFGGASPILQRLATPRQPNIPAVQQTLPESQLGEVVPETQPNIMPESMVQLEPQAVVGQMPIMEQPFAGEISQPTPILEQTSNMAQAPIQQAPQEQPIERAPVVPPIKQRKPLKVGGLTYEHIGDLVYENPEKPQEKYRAPIIEVNGQRLVSFIDNGQISLADWDTKEILHTEKLEGNKKDYSIPVLYQKYQDLSSMEESDQQLEAEKPLRVGESFERAKQSINQAVQELPNLLDNPEQYMAIANQVNESLGNVLTKTEIDSLTDHMDQLAAKNKAQRVIAEQQAIVREPIKETVIKQPKSNNELVYNQPLDQWEIGNVKLRKIPSAPVGQQWVVKQDKRVEKFGGEQQARERAMELGGIERPTRASNESIIAAMKIAEQNKVAPIIENGFQVGSVVKNKFITQKNENGKWNLVQIQGGETFPQEFNTEKEAINTVLKMKEPQGEQKPADVIDKENQEITQQNIRQKMKDAIELSKTSDSPVPFGTGFFYKNHHLETNTNNGKVRGYNITNKHEMEYPSIEEAIKDIDRYTYRKQQEGNVNADDIGQEVRPDSAGNVNTSEVGTKSQRPEDVERRNVLWGRIYDKIPSTSPTKQGLILKPQVRERLVDIFEKLKPEEQNIILRNPYLNLEIINSQVIEKWGKRYDWMPRWIVDGIKKLHFRALVNGMKTNNPFAKSTIYINEEELGNYVDFDSTLIHELSHVMDYAMDENHKDLLNSISSQIYDLLPDNIIKKVRVMPYNPQMPYNNVDFILQELDAKPARQIRDLLGFPITDDSIYRANRMLYDLIKERQMLEQWQNKLSIFNPKNYDAVLRERNANMLVLSPALRATIEYDYAEQVSKPYDIPRFIAAYESNMNFTWANLKKYNVPNAKKDMLSKTMSKIYEQVYDSSISPQEGYDKMSAAIGVIYDEYIRDFPDRRQYWEKMAPHDMVIAGTNIMFDIASTLDKFVDMGYGFSGDKIQAKLNAIAGTNIPSDFTIIGKKEKADLGWWHYALQSPSIMAIKNKVIAPIIEMGLKAQKTQERLRADFLNRNSNIWSKFKDSKVEYDKFIEARLQGDTMGRDMVETFKLNDGTFLNLTWGDKMEVFKSGAKAAEAKVEMEKLYPNSAIIQENTKYYVLGWNDNTQVFKTEQEAKNDVKTRSLEVGQNFGYNKNTVEGLLDSRNMYNKIWNMITAVRKATGLGEVEKQRGYVRHHFDTWIVTIRKDSAYPNETDLIWKDADGKTHRGIVTAYKDNMYTVKSKSGSQQVLKEQIQRVLKYPESFDKGFIRFSNNSLKQAIEEAKRRRDELGSGYKVEIRNKFSDMMSGVGEKNEGVLPDTSLTQEEKDMFTETVALTENDFDTWLKNPEIAYPTLAKAVTAQEVWTNKQLRSAIHNSGARGEVWRSGIYQFIGKRENIKSEELVKYLEHAGTRNRYLEALQKRNGSEGWSKDLERIDNNYILQTSRYIAHQPFKHNSILWYNRVFDTKFENNVPPTRAAKWTKEFMTDMFGIPTEYENALNQTMRDSWLGGWLTENLGDRPSLALAGRINAFNTYTKLGLYRISSAILQLSIFMNINAKLDSTGLTRFTGFGTNTRKYLTLAKHIGNYMKTGKSSNPKAKEYAEVLKYANLDTDFITMANEGGYSAFGSPSQAGKYQSKLYKVIKGSLAPFLYVDMLGRRTAMLGFYDQAINKGMNKDDALEFAEKQMLATNFNQSVADSPNLFRRFGPIGQVVLQFKKFPLKELEFMTNHLHGAENKTFWTSYFLLCGAFGIPAMDWLKELIKGLFDWDVELSIKRTVMKMAGQSQMGQTLAKQMFYGLGASLPSAFGFNSLGVDIHKRIGLSDMFPTRMRDLGGPMFSTMASVIHHFADWNGGSEIITDVLGDFTPIARDYKELVSGEVRSDYNRDRLIMNLSPEQRFIRFLGFKPVEQSVISEQEKIIKYTEDQRKKESKRLIDNYISDKSSSNLAALREAGITTKQVQAEVKRKQSGSVERAIDTTALKRRGQFADIIAFQ